MIKKASIFCYPALSTSIYCNTSVHCKFFLKWPNETRNQKRKRLPYKKRRMQQTRRWRSCRTSCRALCVWRSTAGPECCPVCTSSARPVWRSLRWHREAGSVHRAPTAASRPRSPKGAWPTCPPPSTFSTCLR